MGKSTDRFPAVNQSADRDAYIAETELRSQENVLLSRVAGVASDVLVTRLRMQVMHEMTGKTPSWVIDATGITRVDATTNTPFVDLLKEFRARGGSRVIAAIRLPQIRMIFSTFSMTSSASGGPQVEFVDSQEIAISRLRISGEVFR